MKWRGLVMTVLLPALVGCGTLWFHAEANHGDKKEIYVGVRADAGLLRSADDLVENYGFWGVCMVPLLVIDLPLSLVADTILAPFTLASD